MILAVLFHLLFTASYESASCDRVDCHVTTLALTDTGWARTESRLTSPVVRTTSGAWTRYRDSIELGGVDDTGGTVRLRGLALPGRLVLDNIEYKEVR